MGFTDLTKVSVAVRILAEAIGDTKLRLESIRADQALGRVIGKDIISNRFIPQFDRSIVDGYAVRLVDVQNASASISITLKIVGESKIGEPCRITVLNGQAVAVATGSSIPRGADAVIMVERTKTLTEHEVAVLESPSVSPHISRKGEDVKPGDLVLAKGRRIRPLDVGLMKAIAVGRIFVVRKPRVGIASTGNELTDALQPARKEKIVDISRPILSRMVQELGAIPVDLGIVRDNELEISSMIRKGIRSCDALMVTAGSSVGEKDLVPKCISQLGRPGMLVHGVAMRPAMPTGIAVIKHKPILSLPGFPISTIFAFRVFGRPMIAKLLGTEMLPDPVVKAVLTERLTNSPGFRTFIRARLKRVGGQLLAEPLKVQRSSVTMSIVAANGIITVPEEVHAIEAGQEIEVEVIGEIDS